MSAFHDNALIGASGQQGYQISRSVRLRSSATAYFNRTPASASNRRTWTFSAWLKRGSLGSFQGIFTGKLAKDDTSGFYTASDGLSFLDRPSNVTNISLSTAAVFRDPSAWYHLILVADTTNATSGDRMRLFVNGVRQTLSGTYPSLNYEIAYINNTVAQALGIFQDTSGLYLDGYLTEINFIDGQALTPSSFGETNAVTGVWQPKKYAGTYGTNGFYLNFSDNSSNTSTTIGKDYSGNGNNWTPNNISVTAGVTYDSMLDVPTLWADGENGRGNYAVWNPTIAASTGVGTITNGNLQCVTPTSGASNNYGTMGVSTGKWYWEITVTARTTDSNVMIGINDNTQSATEFYSQSRGYAYRGNGEKWNNGSGVSYGSSAATGDIVGVAFDADAGSIEFFKNGSSMGVAFTGITASTYFPAICDTGTTVSWTATANFGQRPFSYTPPTGFVALNTQNLPAPTISNGAQYMAATLYTGNGSTQTINNSVNGVSFQPDFVWAKTRSTATAHALVDSVRGVDKYLYSSLTIAEETQTTALSSFNSNGFSLAGSFGNVNANGTTYVGWQWKAGGTAVSNTSGSITSTVSAGATQGFSVVTFTAPASGNFTVGHGLGVAPAMMILKDRSAVVSWSVWHKALSNPAQSYLALSNTNAAGANTTVWGNTAPTSTVMTLGVGGAMNASDATVAYCFAEVAGYSKFGSYTGNGSADGPFVYLGFRPRFVLVKRSDSTGDWFIWDSSRDPFNTVLRELYPNGSTAEYTRSGSSDSLDFVSNGFKIRLSSTYTDRNASGGTYIFAAFAENPFKLSLAR